MSLPADLAAAEAELLTALESALASQSKGRWTLDLRFEGLRLAPVALRLQRQLDQPERRCKLLFADAGATALAKRDAPDQADAITSVSDCYRGELPAETSVLICVTPGPPDYDQVETLCDKFSGPVVLLNGRLEDAAVGIGSVARERRRGFMAQWQSAYTLQPLNAAALRHAHPGDWQIYRLDPDGYRLAGSQESKPAPEELDELLSGAAAAGLRSVDRFMRELSG